MKYNFFLLISLLLVNVSIQNSVKCDGETIDKCTACNTGENSGSCSACEDNTFLFFHNLVCLPCNNSIYGQVGCGRKCNGTNFIKTRQISCEEGGCIDGYYRTDYGTCRTCSSISPYCSKCSYEIPENKTYYEFKCLECESDEYIIDQYGKCNNCTMVYCEKCEFDEKKTKTICKKCIEGYDKNKYGECAICSNDTFSFSYLNKICYKCDNIGEPEYCWCKKGYYEDPENPDSKCLECPSGCEDCIYNKETKKIECTECSEEMTISSDKNCLSCGLYCKSCKTDENDNPICTKCYDKHSLDRENYCQYCGYYCLSCVIGKDYNIFCSKCIDGYGIDSQNSCHQCDKGCLSCELNYEVEEEDYLYTSCYEGYALNKNKECIKCEERCESCQFDEKDNLLCSNCSDGYVLNPDKKCVKCEEGCESCEYDEKGNYICLECQYNYILSQNKTCVKCDPNCPRDKCSLDENNNPICSSCNLNYIHYYGQCLRCPDGCLSNCKIDESSKYKNETLCNNYDKGFVLNPDDNICNSCDIFEETGEGCYTCQYNNNNKKYECNTCKYTSYDSSYVFINNKHQCIEIEKRNLTELKGCNEAIFNEKTKKYECTKCEKNYIFIVNENICKSPLDVDLSSYCLEAELVKSKSQYSCLNCSSNSINISLPTGIVDCLKSSDNLTLCLEGTADENRENQKCTKCKENAELNDSNICNCASDSFEVNNVCYKCDNPYSGNIGCLASKGCFYDLLFYTIRCNECKEGYYNNSYGICSPCSDEVPNCEKCHSNVSFGPHNETIVTAICDSCSPLYTLKTENETQTCELNECEEYPEISPGCIICKDKLNEYKPYNKCQTCKYGYFKTKEEKCVYCRSEQYGGPAVMNVDMNKIKQEKILIILYVKIAFPILIIIV